jgi:hypothetical protein
MIKNKIHMDTVCKMNQKALYKEFLCNNQGDGELNDEAFE